MFASAPIRMKMSSMNKNPMMTEVIVRMIAIKMLWLAA